MRRTATITALALLAGLAISFAVPAAAETYLGFQLNLGNAPPPPHVVYAERPRMERVPGSRVMIVAGDPGYDMFVYGSWYYVCNDGYWYRSRTHRGPYMVVDVRTVPRPIMDVPVDRWHHHPLGGPPGQMRRAYRHDDRGMVPVRYKERPDHGREHGRRGR